MPTFQSNPVNPSRVNTLLRKHPSLFGVPFVLLMLGASFGLAKLSETRYELHDQKVNQISKEQELRLKSKGKKFDIREEYYKLAASEVGEQDWENKRIQRPKGLPEWGVPPTEPPPKQS